METMEIVKNGKMTRVPAGSTVAEARKHLPETEGETFLTEDPGKGTRKMGEHERLRGGGRYFTIPPQIVKGNLSRTAGC